MPPDPDALWRFLPVGYLGTVAIEVPVLLFGLSHCRSHATAYATALDEVPATFVDDHTAG